MDPEQDFRLRREMIRLAHAKPGLRSVLLPLIPLRQADPDLEDFLDGFYRKYPTLRTYHPKVLSKASGTGKSGHPEARQSGDEIWLFPKFWDLDVSTRNFVFAHEIGHFVASRGSLAKFIQKAESLGIDPWDSNTFPFGQGNMEEAFADAFATYHLDRNELKRRYPAWLDLVESLS